MLITELTLTTIFGVFCGCITLALGIFALIRAPRKIPNITYFLLTLSLAGYYASHLLGIHAPNAESARKFFMFNVMNIPITVFVTHFIYATFGPKTKGRLAMVIAAYGLGLGLLIFYVTHPSNFMLLPVSKMYLPYYYTIGNLYWIMTVYFFIFGIYVLFDLFRMYIRSNPIEKNRIKYIILGLVYAYPLGTSALLLLYNIPVDPFYSMLFGLYTIPFAYAFLEYEILDIHVVAKRALYFSISVGAVSLFLILINTANDVIVASVPGFPPLLIPILCACGAVGVGTLVWVKIREVDRLKYEFITIVTHKFRTPLTYIKWSMDTLSNDMSEESRTHALQMIQTATVRLNELTDLLVGVEDTEGAEYSYTFNDVDIRTVVQKIIENDKGRAVEKNILLKTQIPDQVLFVSVDGRRLEFALQIFLENAISYTPEHGTIDVMIQQENRKVLVIFKDTGIGISKEELPFMFSKFYRGSTARKVDTEGMGIGLFIAQNIIKKQGGKISVKSDGRGKGSVFTISLPIKKSQ